MYLNQAINQMPFILVFIKQKYQSRWFLHVVAELSRAKRASGAPWVRKFGKLSIR